MPTPTPHKHAALIKQWADDSSQKVWQWSPRVNEWFEMNAVTWDATVHYALGPKPTQPPRKMCSLAGVEFPMPETVAPEVGARYFTPDIVLVAGLAGSQDWNWGAIETDDRWLRQGLIHFTREAAEQHSRALLAANKAAVEGAK